MQEQTGNYDFFQYKSGTYERIWEHWSLLKYMDEDTNIKYFLFFDSPAYVQQT